MWWGGGGEREKGHAFRKLLYPKGLVLMPKCSFSSNNLSN